jgi:chemotaxis protein MotB
MMAFFLLMWLLGATTEKQRKALADYFTPTLVELKMNSAGSTGMFGGDSLMAKENYPTTGGQGNLAITIPRDATGTKDQGGKALRAADRQKFENIKKQLEDRMSKKGLAKLRKNVRFTETREGLRIDLIDEADFAMFRSGTDQLVPEARALIAEVADALQTMPNPLIVRGHTDGLPYASGRSMNNWMLSSARAESTRKALADWHAYHGTEWLENLVYQGWMNGRYDGDSMHQYSSALQRLRNTNGHEVLAMLEPAKMR